MSVRPRVVTANVATVDGRIAASPAVPSWLDGRWAPVRRAGYELVDVLGLHGAFVHLEGSNSFVARDAGPAPLPEPRSTAGLHEDFVPPDVLARFERWMVVPDSRGRVAWTQREGGGTHVLVLVTASTPPGYLAFLRDREIPYLLAGDVRVDLAASLDRLAATFDTDVLVSTAGGRLNGVLLQAGLVTEVDLQVLPIVFGEPDAPTIFEGYADRVPMQMRLLHCETRADGSVFLRLAPGDRLS